MFLEIFCILLLCLPTAWALYDDRNGDKHPNRDLYTVMVAVGVVGLFCALINRPTFYWLDFLRSICLSGAIYVSVFPYAVNYMLWRRGILNTKTWWNHLSKTAWPDRTSWWIGTPWYGRVFFALVILGAALKVYFCPGQLIKFGNCCFCVSLRS
jgi:hypothetical protein